MITILRKHSRWLMIVIAILAMPFCLYFVRTDWMSALRSNTAAKLYGRDISTIEIERGARLLRLAGNLGMNGWLVSTPNATLLVLAGSGPEPGPLKPANAKPPV